MDLYGFLLSQGEPGTSQYIPYVPDIICLLCLSVYMPLSGILQFTLTTITALDLQIYLIRSIEISLRRWFVIEFPGSVILFDRISGDQMLRTPPDVHVRWRFLICPALLVLIGVSTRVHQRHGSFFRLTYKCMALKNLK